MLVVTGAIAGIAIVLGLVCHLLTKPEPTFGNRPLENWITSYAALTTMSSSSNFPLLWSAYLADSSNAIVTIGTNGIPFLLDWIAQTPPPDDLHRTTLKAIGQLPSNYQPRGILLRTSSDEVEFRAHAAPYGFKLLGTNASSAIPFLEKLIRERPDTEAAALAKTSLDFIKGVGLTNTTVP